MEITFKPDKISWNFPFLMQSGIGNDPNYYLQYDSQGRVNKRIGGLLEMSGSIGIPYVFKNSIYTNVTYNANTAFMANYSSDPTFNVPMKEKTFEFNKQGKIIKSIIFAPYYIEWEKHLTYNYDSTGKLVEIVTELPNMPYVPTDPNDYILTYVEKFTYDDSGNLKKAVTTEKHNNIDAYIMKEVEFSNFDTAQNPFRGLGIFEDYFYFSLSKNNCQKRKIQEFNEYNQVISTNEYTWTNQYDSYGNLKLFY